jgi:hypothetical protein
MIERTDFQPELHLMDVCSLVAQEAGDIGDGPEAQAQLRQLLDTVLGRLQREDRTTQSSALRLIGEEMLRRDFIEDAHTLGLSMREDFIKGYFLRDVARKSIEKGDTAKALACLSIAHDCIGGSGYENFSSAESEEREREQVRRMIGAICTG